MELQYFRIYLKNLIFLWLFLASCATIVAPSGGPIDKDAPILKGRSISDSALRYKGDPIVLQFNEQIEAQQVKLQTFPLINPAPEVSIKKGKITITPKPGSLMENTTYRFSFGNSIKDIYEGTAMTDFQFILSTGDQIDSMEILGNVWDAQTGAPDTTSLILLYTEIRSDSDVSVKPPLYVTKANPTGMFTFTHLPNKEFYLYALGDKNNNNLLDYSGERIGYLETTVLPLQKAKPGLNIYTFSIDSSTITNRSGRAKDETKRLSINIDSSNTDKRTFDITQPITIKFAKKITNFSRTSIRLFLDNVMDESGLVYYDSVKNNIILNCDWVEDTVYTLQLLDGFVSDTGVVPGGIWRFRTNKTSDYGSIIFTAKDKPNRIVQLYRNDILVADEELKNDSVRFDMLLPGNYIIKLHHDRNGNKRWDNGQYYPLKRQPEIIEVFTGEVLVKANWVNKLDWNNARPASQRGAVNKEADKN